MVRYIKYQIYYGVFSLNGETLDLRGRKGILTLNKFIWVFCYCGVECDNQLNEEARMPVRVWSLCIEKFHQFLTILQQFRFHENIYPELLLPGQVASEANKKLNEKVFFSLDVHMTAAVCTFIFLAYRWTSKLNTRGGTGELGTTQESLFWDTSPPTNVLNQWVLLDLKIDKALCD